MNHILPFLLQYTISYIKQNKDSPIVKEFLITILDDILKDNRALFSNIKDEIMQQK